MLESGLYIKCMVSLSEMETLKEGGKHSLQRAASPHIPKLLLILGSQGTDSEVLHTGRGAAVL